VREHRDDVGAGHAVVRRGCRLDDPGLLGGDAGHVGPEVLGVVHRHRGDDGDPRVGDVGRVPGAAHPDLDDGDVDRGVGEGGVGHRHHDLEEGHRDAAGVDHLHVGRDVVVHLDEPLGADRLAVEHDPLPYRLQVGAGEPADPQAEAAQQLVDHPRRRGLAVGAGDLHDGERPVRGAQQVEQRGDAGEAGLQPALGPAREERLLDPGQVTGN
jgi:hypothetical protein